MSFLPWAKGRDAVLAVLVRKNVLPLPESAGVAAGDAVASPVRDPLYGAAEQLLITPQGDPAIGGEARLRTLPLYEPFSMDSSNSKIGACLEISLASLNCFI